MVIPPWIGIPIDYFALHSISNFLPLSSLATIGDAEGGMLPLHVAARDGLDHAVALLLRKSDVNAQDKLGLTALHYAGAYHLLLLFFSRLHLLPHFPYLFSSSSF